jgi:tryptophanyl-tRNA synthetase
MPRVFSGIQPTGDMHLGNYLGAVRHWVAAQPSDASAPTDALYCVVDLHAMTVAYSPAELTARTRRTVMLLLAAGLDPQRCTLFVQSHVPQHTELTWYLNCVATFGELRRMTQFKDKSAGQESVSVGLFAYPVLMAADILAYDTDRVPVGDDQRQHLELARDVAIRFNHRFGETLRVPEPAIPAVGARVMDLQEPTNKMSKSADSPQGTLALLDPPNALTKRIKSAVTDSDGEVRYDPSAKPGVSNLLQILAAATDRPVEAVADEHAGNGYGALKGAVAEAVVALLAPLQERYAALEADPGHVDAVIAQGAARASELASSVVARVRDAVGLLPRP